MSNQGNPNEPVFYSPYFNARIPITGLNITKNVSIVLKANHTTNKWTHVIVEMDGDGVLTILVNQKPIAVIKNGELEDKHPDKVEGGHND